MVILPHRVEACHLLRLTICVGQGIVDEFVKSRLAQLKLLG